jgi:hypothetical protein
MGKKAQTGQNSLTVWNEKIKEEMFLEVREENQSKDGRFSGQ